MDAKTLELIERAKRNAQKQSFEVKQERSTPVQSRVDLSTLAELDVYWSKEGYSIKTMSQLVSWSIELLRKILVDNGLLVAQFETLSDAHKYLEARGLYQGSMKRKGFEKIKMAVAFEGLREQGIDPKNEAPDIYKDMHNERSTQPFMPEVRTGIAEEEWQRIKLQRQKEEYEELKRKTSRDIEDAKKRGQVVVEPTDERQKTHYVVGRPMTKEEIEKNREAVEERDKETLAKLNQSPEEQIEFMKKQGLIKE